MALPIVWLLRPQAHSVPNLLDHLHHVRLPLEQVQLLLEIAVVLLHWCSVRGVAFQAPALETFMGQFVSPWPNARRCKKYATEVPHIMV